MRLGILLIAALLILPAQLSAAAQDIIDRSAAAIKKGQLAKARDLLGEGVEIYPDHMPIRFQWGQLMEQVGDMGGAVDAYQGIIDQIARTGYPSSVDRKILTKARSRLDELLMVDPKLVNLVESYTDGNIDLGDKALKDSKFNSARHAFLEALSIDNTNPKALAGQAATLLKLPKEGKNILGTDPNTVRVVTKLARKLIGQNAHGRAITMLQDYQGGKKIFQQEIHLLMAHALSYTGKHEEALNFYDTYLFYTRGNRDPDILKVRKEILTRTLPKLTSTLEELYRRRRIYIASLINFARINFSKNPNQAQKALDEIFKIEPDNERGLRIQNRLIKLGRTSIFENDLRKTWTFTTPPLGRTIASHYSETRFNNGILSLPARARPVRISGPMKYPGYGLLSAEFKIKRSVDENGQVLKPNVNMGFGFLINNSQKNSDVLFLTTYEHRKGRIAVRGIEVDSKNQWKSLGALYTNVPYERLDDWITLEVLRRGNDFIFFIDKQTKPALTIRYSDSGLDGSLGLYGASNDIFVKNYNFTSGFNRMKNLGPGTTNLIDNKNLAGWWQIHEDTRKAIPLKLNENTMLDGDGLRMNVTPGNNVWIRHESMFPKNFVWETTFRSQSNARNPVVEWTFANKDLEEGGYRIRLSSKNENTHIEFINDRNEEGLQTTLARADINHLNPVELHKLVIAVNNGNAVISIGDQPLLSSRLNESPEGYVGIAIKNQVFSISSMTVKRPTTP